MGEERGTTGGEMRDEEFSAMKKQEKTAKITDESHVTVTGTSRDGTCHHVTGCDKSRAHCEKDKKVVYVVETKAFECYIT